MIAEVTLVILSDKG